MASDYVKDKSLSSAAKNYLSITPSYNPLRFLDCFKRRSAIHRLTRRVTLKSREGTAHGGMAFRHIGSPVASSFVSPALTTSKMPCDPRTGITPILRLKTDWSSRVIVQSMSGPRCKIIVSPTLISTVLLSSSRVICREAAGPGESAPGAVSLEDRNLAIS